MFYRSPVQPGAGWSLGSVLVVSTGEGLRYWIKRAKFCEEKVGSGGLMTPAVDIFCWG